jgi:2-keto-4-pentenoate hydratase
MKNKDTLLQSIAVNLWECYTSRKTIPPVTKEYPDLDLDDAYRIQLRTVKLAADSGRKVAGKKIGLTSKPMQEMFGISTPDYGHLYDSMIWSEESRIAVSSLHRPRIEPEIAFILGEDLKGPGVGLTDVFRATAGLIPCFEIIDSRIRNWEITIVDSVSDNASAALITLGGTTGDIRDFDLKNIGLIVEKNGEIAALSAGAAVMGHPALSVAWLANKLGEYGVSLRKGEIILSGSFTKAFDAVPGDVFTASFDRLGRVKAAFC